MTALVVYDTKYGNTAKIAQTVAAALANGATSNSIAEVSASSLSGLDLLIVGSPTHGGQPTPEMRAWLETIPARKLAGVQVAAFDTRLSPQSQNFALRMLMGVIGFAAPRIHKKLQAKGGNAIAAEEGFIVEGAEGPLARGELDRAANWAKGLTAANRFAA
jgi:flavodoxin